MKSPSTDGVVGCAPTVAGRAGRRDNDVTLDRLSPRPDHIMFCHDMLALPISVGRSGIVCCALAGNLSPSSCNYPEKGMK